MSSAMKKTFWSLTVILIFYIGSISAYAQNAVFSRYFQEQSTKRVIVPSSRKLQAASGGEVLLSEREAIEMALESNLDISVERYTWLSSEWSIEEKKSIYDPKGFFDFDWKRDVIPSSTLLQGGTSVTDVSTEYEAGYRQQFSTGTSLEVGFEGSRHSTTSFFSRFSPAVQTNFEITLRQNLLRDFGRIGPDYEIEIARNDRKITEHEFQRQVTDIILTVQQHYWALIHALEDIDVKEKALELGQIVYEQNVERLKAGAASQLEVTEARGELALREEDLSKARFEYQLAQDRLVQLITNYEDPRVFGGQIIPVDRIDGLPSDVGTFEELRSLAIELRPERREAVLQTANRKVELRRSQNELKPKLDLVAGWQQYGLGGQELIRDFSGGLTSPTLIDVIPGGIGDSFDGLISGDYYGYRVGVTLELPIFNSEARAANARAALSLRQSESRIDSVDQKISLEIRDAMTRIQMHEASVLASQTARLAAQERLAGEIERFRAGTATTREVIEAQRDLLEAESVHLKARVALIQAHRSLDKAVGRTLSRNNIRLADALELNVK